MGEKKKNQRKEKLDLVKIKKGAGGELPLVIIALVWGGTLNSSAANLRTAVKGAASGTLNLKEFQKRKKKINKKLRIKRNHSKANRN